MTPAKLHDQLMGAAECFLTNDPDEWVAIDESNYRIGSPCCDANWLQPMLLSALCAECCKPHEAAPLGIVRMDR